MVCACHPHYSRKPKIEWLWSRPAWAESETCLQYNQSKKSWKVAYVVERLPSKCKALGSKKKKKKYHQKKKKRIF
jgi:hypothetical protein